MIEKLVRFSVNNRGLVFALALILAGLGWTSFQALPIDAVPDITNNQVQVNTAVEGLTPEEIERYITVPIENGMGGLADLVQTRSISRFGLSQVTLVFEDWVDIYRARQMVSERLQGVVPELPEGIQPGLGPVTTGLGEVYFYTLQASTPAVGAARVAQLMELKSVQDWYVKPRLLTVPGVAEVNSIGGFEKQFHVQPNIRQMAQYGLHFNDLIGALENTNRNVGGGYIQQTGEQFLVQATGLLKDAEDIRHAPIKSLESLKTIRIGDVAQVQLATELRTGAALVNGREDIVGTALMRLGENSRVVAHRVAQKVAEIKKGLPEGVVLNVLYDRSVLVDATLGTVEHNLVTGALLVIVILVLLLGNLRAALITAVTIPLTLLITFIVMNRMGMSGNLMSLGALDFGIIVDGVVIVIDNCVRRVHQRSMELHRALKKEELARTIEEATLEIRQSAGFGQLVIVVVFLPIFAFTGVEGKMFVPMVGTFCIALLAAFVLSFTIAPALASLFLKGDVGEKEPWLMLKIRRAYEPTLKLFLKHRPWVLALGAFSILLGGFLFTRLGGEFLPQLDEGSLAIQFVRPGTISIDQSVALQEKTEAVIREFPQVSHVFSRIGTAEVATDPMGVNLSDTFILLKDKDGWEPIDGRKPSKADLSDALVERLRRKVPGQRMLLTQPIQMRFNELLEGTRADISVKIFGDDMDLLSDLSGKIKSVIDKVPGAGDVELEIQGKSPLLHVEPNLELLHSLGVSNREVLETVGTAVGGQEVGVIYEGMKRFPIVVRLNEKDRSDLDALKTLPVGISANSTVPLAEAASLRFTDTFGAYSREMGKRRVAILVNPRGRDTEGFVAEARRKVDEAVKIPSGYFIEWGGNFKNLQQAKSRLAVLTPLVLVLVLGMIYIAFRNVYETFLIFSCVPLALVGGVLGLMLNGLPFSISAGVGFVALSGIAVLNGVVLINCFNDLHREGVKGQDLIHQGTDLRIRPVLMTALVEIFGFLPMMLSSGVGSEVQRPLASVVIGGVVSSTLLTLVVLPVLVSLLEKKIWSEKEVEL
ncbi:MAG: efflux RND transporter permease subunit [Elusimicrobia bacterium]|jgi:cobalt-zinc-cadmium resistance protein CzcA|nr:efflux RND transporter permease subunit [Elusimicrobiota bacterium]